nr:MAG TPA: hypothetical protein [Caudoviricetes sp.]
MSRCDARRNSIVSHRHALELQCVAQLGEALNHCGKAARCKGFAGTRNDKR